MRRALVAVVLLILTWTASRAIAAAPAPAPAPPAASASPAIAHPLLAHAGDDRMWVARVTATPDASQAGGAGGLRTDILIRPMAEAGGREDWKTFASVPTRVTAMANRGPELAVLLNDGSWMRIWAEDGAAGGAALPADGQMRALTNDATSLWAIGSVRGGLYAALHAVATTRPDSAAPAEPTHGITLPFMLVLFHAAEGSWTPVAQLPADAIVPTAAPLWLAIVGGQPIVSFQQSTGSVRTIRFAADFSWQDIGLVRAPDPGKRITDFCLLALRDRPLLWISEAEFIGGKLSRGGDAAVAGFVAMPEPATAIAKPVELQWKGAALPQSPPALAIGREQLHQFALHGDKIFEQAYRTDSSAAGGCTPIAPAAALAVPGASDNAPLQYGIFVALLIAIAFSAMATFYRRQMWIARRQTEAEGSTEQEPKAPTPPPPAPLLPRLGAGLIDLLPVIVCSAVLTVRSDALTDPLQQLSSSTTMIASLVAAGVYLLHTTLSEVFGGRTIGKWALGLRPVTITGQRPTATQMVVRNVLRLIDLLWFPLVLVLISPLRQRSADVAAGTMVVREKDAARIAANQTVEAEDGRA